MIPFLTAYNTISAVLRVGHGAYRSRLTETAERINLRFGAGGYQPIISAKLTTNPPMSSDFFVWPTSATLGVCMTG